MIRTRPMRLALALAAVVTLAGSGAGWAETYTPIPRYDVDRGCARFNTQAEPTGARGCIKLEQDSYNYLVSAWPYASELVRKAAIRFADKAEADNRTRDEAGSAVYPMSFYYFEMSASLKYDLEHPAIEALPDHFRP